MGSWTELVEAKARIIHGQIAAAHALALRNRADPADSRAAVSGAAEPSVPRGVPVCPARGFLGPGRPFHRARSLCGRPAHVRGCFGLFQLAEADSGDCAVDRGAHWRRARPLARWARPAFVGSPAKAAWSSASAFGPTGPTLPAAKGRCRAYPSAYCRRCATRSRAWRVFPGTFRTGALTMPSKTGSRTRPFGIPS